MAAYVDGQVGVQVGVWAGTKTGACSLVRLKSGCMDECVGECTGGRLYG